MTKVYDALIIGAGAAGLSAALGLGRVHRSAIVFSAPSHRNNGAAHIHNVLTRDHTVPADFYAAARKDLERYNNTVFVETTITSVKKTPTKDGAFVASNAKGETWHGRTVVLATGVKDVFPDLPGYAENWPQNIYQCPFCDGHERADLPIGVLAYPGFNPMLVRLATIAHAFGVKPGEKNVPGQSKVTLFTNGKVDMGVEANAAAMELCRAKGIKVEERKVVKLEDVSGKKGVDVGVDVRLEDGERVFVGFVLHKPPTELVAKEVIDGLGLETRRGMFGDMVKTVNMFKETSVEGVFAAGDVCEDMTAVDNALFTGACAAGGVAHYVGNLDDKEALEWWKAKASMANGVKEKIEKQEGDVAGCADVKEAVLDSSPHKELQK